MVLLLILFYIIVISFESIALFKERNKNKLIFYSFLIVFSMIVNILLYLGVHLPSPSNLIKNIVVSIFGKTN